MRPALFCRAVSQISVQGFFPHVRTLEMAEERMTAGWVMAVTWKGQDEARLDKGECMELSNKQQQKGELLPANS